MFKAGRLVMWCVANFLIWPMVRPFVKYLHWIDFLFVVYPGTDSDVRAYAPLWFRKAMKEIFSLSLIGIVCRGKEGKRGLIITLSCNPEEFSAEQLKNLYKEICVFANSCSAASIALAGRLPSIFISNQINLDYPFLKGDRGTVFTVTESVKYILNAENISLGSTIGVLGVGFVGGKVLRRLREQGYTSLIGIDPRVENPYVNKHTILTGDLTFLNRCDVVIVLTSRGSEATEAIPYLKEGAVVIDDTHPQLPYSLVKEIRKKGGKVYKAALGFRSNGVKIFPRLPGYNSKWLPGCVIESLVVSNGYNGNIQERFDQKGREIGLKPLLVVPRGEV